MKAVHQSAGVVSECIAKISRSDAGKKDRQDVCEIPEADSLNVSERHTRSSARASSRPIGLYHATKHPFRFSHIPQVGKVRRRKFRRASANLAAVAFRWVEDRRGGRAFRWFTLETLGIPSDNATWTKAHLGLTGGQRRRQPEGGAADARARQRGDDAGRLRRSVRLRSGVGG